jgi:hypothetical protein
MFTCCTLGVNSREDAWLNRRRGEWSCQVQTGGIVCLEGPSPSPSACEDYEALVAGWSRSERSANEESPWSSLVFCVSAKEPPFEGRTGKKEQQQKKNHYMQYEF